MRMALTCLGALIAIEAGICAVFLEAVSQL